MLEVPGPPEIRREQLLLVRHAVAVRIGVLPHFVRIGLHRQDAVRAERRHEAWEHHLVDEGAMVLVHAVVVPVLVHGNPADGRGQVDAVQGLVVAAQLHDEHPAVAVERDLSRLLDVGVGEHGGQVITRRKPEASGLFGRRQRNDRGLRREVGAGVGGIAGGGGFKDSAAVRAARRDADARARRACWRSRGRLRSALRLGRAPADPQSEPDQGPRAGRGKPQTSRRRLDEHGQAPWLSEMFSTTEITEIAEKHQSLLSPFTPFTLW